MINRGIIEPAYDYIFERVVRRTGHFYMSTISLMEWEKDHPRMRGRLATRGIGIIAIDSTTVKITSHGRRFFHSN